MNRPESHARYEELAAGMALHALEPEDEQDFVTHLSGCALCQRDSVEHEAVLAELAQAAYPVEPPSSLLEGIWAGVLASGRAVGPQDAPSRASVPAPVVAGPSAPVPVSLDAARRRRSERPGRAVTWVGAAAAAALVVSMGVWSNELRQQRDAQVQASAQLADTLERLEDPSTETVRLQSEAGDVVAVALVGGSAVDLVLDGLPVNDAGTSYVLWGEEPDGTKRAVGAFDVTGEGLEVRQGMKMEGDVQRLMVTHEHGDTAPGSPTLPVLAVGEV